MIPLCLSSLSIAVLKNFINVFSWVYSISFTWTGLKFDSEPIILNLAFVNNNYIIYSSVFLMFSFLVSKHVHSRRMLHSNLVRKQTFNHLAYHLDGVDSKPVCDMIKSNSQCVIQTSFRNTAWSFDQLTKMLSVRLRTKWLWVRIPLESLKFKISRLFWVMSRLFWISFLDIQAITDCRLSLSEYREK